MLRNSVKSSMLLPLLALSYPLVAFIGVVIDGQNKVRDFNGYLTWVAVSNHSGEVRILLLGSLAIYAVFLLFSRGRNGFLRNRPFALLWAAIIALACLLRGDLEGSVYASLATLFLFAVSAVGVSERDLRNMARTVTVVLVSSVAFALINPARALIECRADKCTPFGGLLTSYMPQENVLALYAVASLAVVLFGFSSWRKMLAVFLCVGVVIGTGSRSALLASGVVILVFLLSKNGRTIKRFVNMFAGYSALIASMLSLLVFWGSRLFGDLTGRDFIFRLLSEYFVKMPLIGPGREVLQEAYELGNSANFLLAHEHGQLPYVLMNGGVLAAIAFVAFTFFLGRARFQEFGRRELSVLTVSMAVFFLTEPSWVADPRSPTFWILAITVGIFAGRVSADAAPQPHEELGTKRLY